MPRGTEALLPMGIAPGAPGTVVGAMADPSEPVAGDEAPASEPTEPPAADPVPGGRRRTLDRRTIAIAAVLGVAAAILTVLIASALLSDDDTSGQGMVLKDPSGIDTAKLFALPVADPKGEPTKLGAYLDEKPMVVNFWASTCPPCVAEMPLLDQASKDNPDVTFVGIATLDTPGAAEKLAKQTGITYPWVLDDTGETAYEADGTTLPTTLLLSADGDVLDRHVGEFHSQEDVQTFVDQAG